MTKTGKMILSVLLIASISLTALPGVFPQGTPQAAESVSQPVNSVEGKYDALSDTITFTGTGVLTRERFVKLFGGYDSVHTVVVSDGITGVEDLGNFKIDRMILGKDVRNCEAYVQQEYRVDENNPALASYDGALYTKYYVTLLRFPALKEDIRYPQQLITIGSGAFAKNEASIIVIPWGVTTILEGGITGRMLVKVLPDTITRFDLPYSYRFPGGFILWEGENGVIEAADEVYSPQDDSKGFNDAISSYWEKYGYRRISDVCKGITGQKITGWYTISNHTFYFQSDGKAASGWKWIDGKWYYFSRTGEITTGMVQLENGYSDELGKELFYYFGEDGALVTNRTVTWKGKNYYVNEKGVAVEEGSGGISQPAYDGLVTLNGKTYYYINGIRQTGLHYINGKAYIFDGNGVMQKSGWYTAEGSSFYLNDYGAGAVKCWRLGKDGKYRYLKADGRMAVNEWVIDYGKTYYVGADGRKYTGSCIIDGKHYTFDSNGVLISGTAGQHKPGLQYINGKAYIFDENGNMLRSGWYTADGSSFYLNDYGAGVVKCWRLGTDGKYRYLKADGRMAVNEWVVDYGKTYYVGADGKKYTGTRIINCKSYTFDSNGVLATGSGSGSSSENVVKYVGGKAYIYDENGNMLRSGWYQAGGNSYYLNDYGAGVVKCWRLGTDGKYRYLGADGKMQTNCWIKDYNRWYYVKGDGSRYESCWVKFGNKWYWFGGSGKMAESQWLTLNGKKYYFTDSGAMAANRWIQDGKYWYYLGPDGTILTNTVTPDGYRVDSQGRKV